MEQSNMDIQSFQTSSEEFVNKYKRMEEELFKAEKELKNIKKYRKELLNLVMDIGRRHGRYQNLLVDHMDKLTICATNLYENIPDICQDRKALGRRPVCLTINRAQRGIKDRKIHPGPTWGIITDSSVSPTRHPAAAYKLRPWTKCLSKIRHKGELRLIWGHEILRSVRPQSGFGPNAFSDGTRK